MLQQEKINPNICDNCKEPEVSYDFYETGVCGQCGECRDCVDPELIELYKGLGFDADYVRSHLPRLRTFWLKDLTMEDIGKEIAKHLDYLLKKKASRV